MSIEKRMSLSGRPSIIRRGNSGKIRLSGNRWSMEIDGSAHNLTVEDEDTLVDMVAAYLASLPPPEDEDDGK